MSKFAPGPYPYVRRGPRNSVQTICVQDANGRNIASVYGKENGEKEYTARLFACAPSLLLALEKVIEEWDHTTRHGSPFALAEANRRSINPAKALIALLSAEIR